MLGIPCFQFNLSHPGDVAWCDSQHPEEGETPREVMLLDWQKHLPQPGKGSLISILIPCVFFYHFFLLTSNDGSTYSQITISAQNISEHSPVF